MSYDNEKQQGHNVASVEEEESISAKAKETGQIFKELISSMGKKTRTVVEEKSRQLKEAADDKDIATRDAEDIQMLGSHIDRIIAIFDSAMDRIRQHPLEEQQRLLVGLKKMLNEEIYVINARLNMAKRLKTLEPSTVPDAIEGRVQDRTKMNAADAEVISPPILESEEETAASFATKQESEQL